jgi:hypothetical protein
MRRNILEYIILLKVKIEQLLWASYAKVAITHIKINKLFLFVLGVSMIVAKCFQFTMFKLDIRRWQLACKFCRFGNVILKFVTTHANLSIYLFWYWDLNDTSLASIAHFDIWWTNLSPKTTSWHFVSLLVLQV